MPRYHITKATQSWQGQGYMGFTSMVIGHTGRLEFDDYAFCVKLLPVLLDVNPVGWCLWDSLSGRLLQKLTHDRPMDYLDRPTPFS